ncbi:MAG: 50S ribosomal protein L30e [Sulfolobales archaeon]
MSLRQAGVEETVKEIVRTGNIVIGFRRTLKMLRLGKLRAVIIARHIPENMFSEITYIARLSETPLIVFEGGSVELGSLIGKPFPVSTIGVVDTGVVPIDRVKELSNSGA